MVLEKFDPGEETHDACVLSVRADGRAWWATHWRDLHEAWRDLFETRRRTAPSLRWAASRWRWAPRREGPEDVPLVSSKQFRDVADSSSACYQAIVAASCKVTAFRSGRRLGGTFSLAAANFRSHPIASDFVSRE